MRVLNVHVLRGAKGMTGDASAWLDITKKASWAGPADVRSTHSGATHAGGKTWNFPLPHDGVTIEALVSFRTSDVSLKSMR